MKRHTVSAEELNDFTFTRDIASSTDAYGRRKRLEVFVNPAHAHLHFNVRQGDTTIFTTGALGQAIEAYNDLP